MVALKARTVKPRGHALDASERDLSHGEPTLSRPIEETKRLHVFKASWREKDSGRGATLARWNSREMTVDRAPITENYPVLRSWGQPFLFNEKTLSLEDERPNQKSCDASRNGTLVSPDTGLDHNRCEV